MARPKKQTTPTDNVMQMTQDAYNELQVELEHRQTVQRKEIADEIAIARDLGDLSENHAYTVAMERKDLNENRISEIEDILLKVQIVQENTSDNIVSVGETIEIMNLETTKKLTVILVGSAETKSANPATGKISIDSPVGKAVYNSKIGDTVDVILPSKIVQYKVVRFIKNKPSKAA